MPKLKPDDIAPTPEEDAATMAAIASDLDAQGWEDAGPWRPAAEVLPDVVASYRRMRGKQRAPTKVKLAIRLDADVVEHFRATGKGWHVRINETLRKAALGK